jgi:hypothetical protein
MKTSRTLKKLIRSKKGQTLIELTLMFPIMLALVYGAVEVGSVISAYLTITHTTREGANLTSRGTDPDLALAAIKTAADPLIRDNNLSQWRIIYSRIIQDPTAPPCAAPPCKYIVANDATGQIPLGNFGQTSKLGAKGAQITQATLPGIENVLPNQTFHAIEVYYDYTPNVMTYIGSNLINKTFYERTIFTDVNGK